METFFREIHMPTNMTDLGVVSTAEDIEDMAQKCIDGSGEPAGSAKKLYKKDMVAIYEGAR